MDRDVSLLPPKIDKLILWVVIPGIVILEVVVLYLFLPREWPLVLQMGVAYTVFTATPLVFPYLPLPEDDRSDDDDDDGDPPRGIE